jgi:L-ornithine Nalpha-acyltransferase
MISEPTLVAAPDRAAGFGELRAGNLGARLAATAGDIDAVQALRYDVFYEEMGARPSESAAALRRDIDAYDAVADHLLVVDNSIGPGPEGVVGTYRLIRAKAMAKIGRFYSADEYDISTMTNFPGQVLELGRSCVHPAYRDRAAMQLLWRAIAAYVRLHNIDLMFGCASLPGTDPDAIGAELTYLYHCHLAPVSMRPRALAQRYVDMSRVDIATIDTRRALSKLPPLIKGYLRLGGFVGDGAVIDTQFNTTDVAVVVKTDLVTEKYLRHFDRESRESVD